MQLSGKGGKKIYMYINVIDPGHMNKTAVMSIYGKLFKKLSSPESLC